MGGLTSPARPAAPVKPLVDVASIAAAISFGPVAGKPGRGATGSGSSSSSSSSSSGVAGASTSHHPAGVPLSREADKAAYEEEHPGNVPIDEMLQCLAVGGRLLTCNSVFQVDPGVARQLHLRNASLAFHFPVSSLFQGSSRVVTRL